MFPNVDFACVENAGKGEAPQKSTAQQNSGFGSSDQLNSGAKVWVQTPNGPPKLAEIIATGKDNMVLVIKSRQEKWEYVPVNKCYLRE